MYTVFLIFFSQEELYLQRVAELDKITNERDNFRQAYEDLRKQRLNEFMAGFYIITNKLKENYQMLTLGGDAELDLVDSMDPFSEGITFRFVMMAYTKFWIFLLTSLYIFPKLSIFQGWDMTVKSTAYFI